MQLLGDFQWVHTGVLELFPEGLLLERALLKEFDLETSFLEVVSVH